MARKRRPGERSSYQGAPTVPPELTERAMVVQAVIGKQMSVSEGARRLGMARPNFQTIVHRAEAALLEALTPRPAGKVPRATNEVTLERENQRLSRENAKLTDQLHTMDRLLGAAGEVIRGLRQPARPRSSKRSPTPSSPSSRDEDPEPGPGSTTPPSSTATTTRPTSAIWTATMTDRSLPTRLCARGLGTSPATLRRYRRHGPPLGRRTRRRALDPDSALRIRQLVRDLRGLAGAASLARCVPHVSRRQAGELKAAELTALERERKAASRRVEVQVPGVLRGFDQVEMRVAEGRRYLLVAADAAVPYRTTVTMVTSYDGEAVARVLDEDFAVHGAPLVCRLDRASCHRTPGVASVLRRHRVLPLHGPARHPRYYGQLERQNREHRAWLAREGPLDSETLQASCEPMRAALNRLWSRPTLKWCTASSVWEDRPAVTIDRDTLRAEVTDRSGRLQAQGLDRLLADRIAIEHALVTRELLSITNP